MHGKQRRHRAKFHREISVAHGIHGILRDHRPAFRIDKAEQFRGQLAIQRQR